MDFPLLLDACSIIKKVLSQFGLVPKDPSTQGILRSYFNFKHKFIYNRPREVLMSNHLLDKAKSMGIDDILSDIEAKFRTGADVNPFLSKGVFRLSDHDYLLNDWSIHHLHMNADKDRPGDFFNKRSSNLLFVHIILEKVYLIDIRPHNESHVFAQRDLLRIIRDNWAELDRSFKVRAEPMNVWPKFDEGEISMMRRKGYMFFTQVDDHAYMPGAGSACSGYSIMANMEMDQFVRDLYKIHCYVAEYGDELLSKLAISEMKIGLVYKDWLFYPYEFHSGQFLDLNLKDYRPPHR